MKPSTPPLARGGAARARRRRWGRGGRCSSNVTRCSPTAPSRTCAPSGPRTSTNSSRCTTRCPRKPVPALFHPVQGVRPQLRAAAGRRAGQRPLRPGRGASGPDRRGHQLRAHRAGRGRDRRRRRRRRARARGRDAAPRARGPRGPGERHPPAASGRAAGERGDARSDRALRDALQAAAAGRRRRDRHPARHRGGAAGRHRRARPDRRRAQPGTCARGRARWR